MSTKPIIYHEKQIKELCALHALNNLFQARNSFTKADLDTICSQLSPNVWINPHRSMLGLGNYDINVIMSALQKKGYEAIWFDKRKDPGCLDLSNIRGFILNVPSDYKIGFMMLPLRRRHWITIRQIHGHFYNLDSKLDAPLMIGRSSDLIAYLKEQLDSKEKELFVVVSSEVERSGCWALQYPAPPPAPPPQPYSSQPFSRERYSPERYSPERYSSERYSPQPYTPQPKDRDTHITYYDSPDSISSSSNNSYQNRDAEWLRLNDVRNSANSANSANRGS